MKKIITISREFGSSGKTIGKEIAKRLNYDFYDKEILERVSSETGFNQDFISERGEDASSKSYIGFSFFNRNTVGLSIDDFLWINQSNVISEIAKKGNCVIVGRCADYILKDNPDVLNVFIYADLKTRMDYVLKTYGETEKDLEKRITDKDKKRRTYYNYYTNQKWGNAHNYHVSLDSGKLGVEKCIDIVCSIVKESE